ncbi:MULTISPECIES: OPT family oligopeptide transporter [Paenibacillus]|uniref:OPT family oligopeptide transporter n=1 Tax=Paenibacillus TaxID=44249 RepID=UPI001B05FF2B|nr:oligopeptide transporter, OPT family [Paenibacillus lactis]GIO93390.1 oligopeptide transporter, OPT family protein [Paenibacillus lactis]
MQDGKQAQASKGTGFVPYIPASKSMAELTVFAIILGIVLAVVFAAANAYLGLKIGLTVSASIPAAVISLGVLRGIFRRQSILENNIVQTMTTAGEAVAAGTIFTLPALYMWNHIPSMATVSFIVLVGGFLGVAMMVPLRRLLIVNEHATLPYPEGMACAEVLKSGDRGGRSALFVVYGFLIGGVVKAMGDGFKWFRTEIETYIYRFKNALIGMDIYPALLGVGYIIGPRISGQMLAGGALAWLVLIPTIGYIGAGGQSVIAPSAAPIGELTAWGLWEDYIRYIGAGAVAAGGLITLVKTLPMLFGSLFATLGGLRSREHGKVTLDRTNKDIPAFWVFVMIAILIVIIAFAPLTDVGIIGAIAIAVFGFLFVTVASRIVGLVGSSSSPVSGMTIATLLFVTFIFKMTGLTGMTGMIASLTVGAIVCVALAVSSDISQDLKTGYLVGGTPWKQQVAMMIGVLVSGLVIGFILSVLNESYGLGSEQLPAPKAVLMRIIVEGIMAGSLPWDLVFIGVAAAVVIELLGLNSLTVAVGIYLPIHVSVPIMIGGVVRWLIEIASRKNEQLKAARVEKGTLLASGLIAGESLIGVIIAVLIWMNVDIPGDVLIANNVVPLLVFLVVTLILIGGSLSGKQERLTEDQEG